VTQQSEENFDLDSKRSTEVNYDGNDGIIEEEDITD